MNTLRKNPMYRFLAVMTIASMMGLQAWRTLFDNFAVNVAGLDGNHIGMIQSFRETPGFLTLLVVFVIMMMREHRLSAISIFVLGLGVAATGQFPTFLGLLLTTMLMSFGFHYFETTNQSLTLQYFDEDTSPLVFGRLRALAAASNVLVGALIYVVSPLVDYQVIYLVAGGVLMVIGVWGVGQDPSEKDLVPQRKEMVFRRRYWLYYFLTFMAGARRQIFVAFAVFLLVKKFEFTVQHITVLFVVNNIINYFLSPLIGKCIVRFGERKVLSLEYFSLIFVFLGYAIAESGWVVAVLYVLDHIFFGFAIAIRTFFQKIGDPQDIAPSMAVGFTINHIAAVVLPAAGGLLWIVDYRIPFVCGAALSVVSLAAVQKIKLPVKVVS
jgi:hypothetical protein